MKNKVVLTILMILACSACFAGSLIFKSPILDTTVLPDAYTSSLLHFDGNLTDIAGNVWTGSPTYDAGKFGQAIKQVMPAGAVGYTQATLSSAKTPFEAGWGAFTCEFWLGIDIDMLSYTTSQGLAGVNLQGTKLNGLSVMLSEIDPANNEYQLEIRAAAAGLYNISGYSSAITDIDGTQWYHICFERRADATLYMYINGQILGSGLMGVDLNGLTGVWLATQGTPSASSTVYIDEFSFSKGVAKYQGAFTPATMAYGELKPNKISLKSDGVLSFVGSIVPDGVAAWFDAADTDTITASGGYVTEWRDKSGNNYHATSSAGLEPITGATTQNGKNVIDFAGSQSLTAPAGVVPVGTSTYTLLAVWRSDSARGHLIFGGGQFSYASWGFETINDGIHAYWWGADHWYYNSVTLSAPMYTLWSWDGSTDTVTVNEQTHTAAMTSKNTYAYADTTIGALVNQYYLTGFIAEILIYHRALTPAEIQQVKTYLITKWGL